MVRLLLTIAGALVATEGAAYAHTGLGDAHGFAHGFSHPMGGLDHILAMVAVGLFAAHLGGRTLVLVPAAFMTMMAIGGALGMAGVALPMVDAVIGLSVVTLGLVICLDVDMATTAAMALVGFFALFHGHAHGAEMPQTASGLEYAAGFILATATLHAVGAGLGLLVARLGERRGRRVLQTAGGAMAAAGVAILSGWA
jgi:urease accessory protein